MAPLATLLTTLLLLLTHLALPSYAASCDAEQEKVMHRLCDELLCKTDWLGDQHNATHEQETFCQNGWREHPQCSNCRNIPGYSDVAQCCQIPLERRQGCFARIAVAKKECRSGPNKDLDPAKYPVLLETEPPIPDLVEHESVGTRSQVFGLAAVVLFVGVLAMVRFAPHRAQGFRARVVGAKGRV